MYQINLISFIHYIQNDIALEISDNIISQVAYDDDDDGK